MTTIKHVLVSSRREVNYFLDLTSEEVSDLWLTAKYVGQKLSPFTMLFNFHGSCMHIPCCHWLTLCQQLINYYLHYYLGRMLSAVGYQLPFILWRQKKSLRTIRCQDLLWRWDSLVLVGTRDLRPLWSPPVSLNLVHVLVLFRNF